MIKNLTHHQPSFIPQTSRVFVWIQNDLPYEACTTKVLKLFLWKFDVFFEIMEPFHTDETQTSTLIFCIKSFACMIPFFQFYPIQRTGVKCISVVYRQLWAFQILTQLEKNSGIQVEIQPQHISFLASMDNLRREHYTTISYNTIIKEKTKPQICFAKEFEMARN